MQKWDKEFFGNESERFGEVRCYKGKIRED